VNRTDHNKRKLNVTHLMLSIKALLLTNDGYQSCNNWLV